MRRNILDLANHEDNMAMQPQARMNSYLFDAWISHFITLLQKSLEGISATNQHLLVVDGHNSHVTLQVACKVAAHELDILMMPSHTSHHLQPLDLLVFRPFKCAFRKYRDAWMLRHKNIGATKEELCQWISLALKKALTTQNILKGFSRTGIFPLNDHTIYDKMGPSKVF